MKNLFRKLTIGTSLAVVGILLLTFIVLAVPGGVTSLIGTVTDTSVYLTWVNASSSNSTLIRHSTTTYPATTDNGTVSYNGTASYATISGLTAGATYYFSAWGFDGSDYSATAANLVVTTLPSVSENTTVPFPKPSLPAVVTQDPTISGWSIYPIDVIIDWFADPNVTHGGLGMPVDNVVMFMAGLGVTFVSLGSYIKWRSFLTSWFIAFLLSIGLSSIGVMQWIVVIYLLLVGLAVAALNNALE